MKKNIFSDAIALAFIFLFMYAATSKLMAFGKFRVQLGQSPLLTAFAGWMVWLVPLTELVISLLLIFSKFRLWGFYASLNLMILFSAYIIAITKFSDFVPCSCGGILQKMTWEQHLIFNLVFVGLGVIGISRYHTPQANAIPA